MFCIGTTTSLIAQSNEAGTGKDTTQPTFDLFEIERTAVGQGYIDTAQRDRLQYDVGYIDQLEGDLATYKPNPKKTAETNQQTRSGGIKVGGIGVLFVVLAIVLALALLFFFAGNGQLLSKTPSDVRQKQAAPAHWDMEDFSSHQAFFDQLDTLADGREKMILLLRYSLLSAAEQNDVRFARSDTEREALRRIPDGWTTLPQLRELLIATERVHYGGEEVSTDLLSHSIDLARQLVTPRTNIGTNMGTNMGGKARG